MYVFHVRICYSNLLMPRAYLFNTAFPARLLNFANNKRFDKKYVEVTCLLKKNFFLINK